MALRMTFVHTLFCSILAVITAVDVGEYDPEYGTYIGKMSTLWHEVTGDVYAVDDTTIHIRGFSYDGEAPDAFFFAGNRDNKPSSRGFIIPNEKNSKDPLGPYRNANLVLKFPITPKGQRSFHDIKWISVWCRQFAIDFGHVKIPSNLITPSSVKGDVLESDKPLVTSSTIMIEDTDTIQIPKFSYDGSVTDAIFVMGSGDAEAAGIQVPDEKGSVAPIGQYNRKNLKLKIPDSAKGQPVQYFGVWSPSQGMLASAVFDPNGFIPPNAKHLI